MKKVTIVLVAVFFSLICFSQEKDTTRIKMGNKRIMIIDSDEVHVESENKLENGKANFEKQIKELEKEKEELDAKKADITDDEKKVAKIEEEIEKVESKIKALEKGIQDIEADMADKEDDEDNDKDVDFDWNESDFSWDWDWEDGFKKRKEKKRKEFNGHWAGLDIGWNDFLNSDNKMELPTDGEFMELDNLSMEISFNFMEQHIPFGKNIGLTTGMGIQWNKYNFKQDITLYENAEGVTDGFKEIDKDFKINKYRTTYLNIPLLLEFQIPTGKKGKEFYFGGGVVGGVRVGSKLKQEFKEGGVNRENNVIDDFQTNRFRYGATVRLGFENLHLFANYSLVPLFENNKGPELYPFTIGITIIDF